MDAGTVTDILATCPDTHLIVTSLSTAQPVCAVGPIMLSTLSSLQPRQLLTQILNFALVLSTAFMLWKGLSVATDSPSPIVVVLSGSMEPAFQRGDLLFLWNRGQNTQIGEIVVYNVRGKDIPIVHRVVRRYGGRSVFPYDAPTCQVPICTRQSKIAQRCLLTVEMTGVHH
ncbi:MAG: hypothetical protein Q9194_001054 [Teloschistes cf. exilis]